MASNDPQPDPPSPAPSAAIIGGGLAGIAAALRLAERGVSVTLVEQTPRLGGRATGVADPGTGEIVDNCQHALMGCCTNLVDLYKRLGVAGRITWRGGLYFADECGRIDRIVADDLPAPLHLARSLLGMRMLTVAEKVAIGRGMLAILQIGERGRRYLRDISFAQWLIEHRQPPGAIRKFWSAVILSACNDRPEHVAARYAVQVFQEGLLSHEDAYRVGLPAVPLTELYDAAEHALRDAGGCILTTGTQAIGFDFDGHRIAALRLAGGVGDGAPRKLRAQAYIAAVPFDRVVGLCSELMLISDVRLRALGDLRASPIIGVHLYLRPGPGTPIMPPDTPYLSLAGGPLHWVFDKGTVETGPHAGATHLHGVIGGGHDLADAPAHDIAAAAQTQLRGVLPAFAGASIAHTRVLTERRATLSVRPGVDHFRPSAAGAIDNLLLAGDWVDTGWPATMEGAVRSGYRAAAAALRLMGRAVSDADLLAQSLKPGPLYRFMSG